MSQEQPAREELINNAIVRLSELRDLLGQPVANLDQFAGNAPYVINTAELVSAFRSKSQEVIQNLNDFLELHRNNTEVLTDAMLSDLLAKGTNAPASITFDYEPGGTHLQHNANLIQDAFTQALTQFNTQKANLDLGTADSTDWTTLLEFARTRVTTNIDELDLVMTKFQEQATLMDMSSEDKVGTLAAFISGYFASIQTIVYAQTKGGVDDLYGNIFNAFTNIFSYIMIMSTPPSAES